MGTIKLLILTGGNSIGYGCIVDENGTYTFTVRDLNTGKTYNKSVEVTNIDNNLNYAIVGDWNLLFLMDKEYVATTFKEAYIFWKGGRVDVTSLISNDYNGVYLSIDLVDEFLNYPDFAETYQHFEFVKDGKSYFGVVKILLGE